MKLMSLFDGSGSFPLSAKLCGIEPVYASEIEPFPIAVTRARFPYMIHLGDVSKINGAELEPVDEDKIKALINALDFAIDFIKWGMKNQ